MQVGQGRFAVRNVSPTRAMRLFVQGRGFQVSASAASSAGSQQQQPPPAADLVQWVESSGGSVSGVRITRNPSSGFGLQAAADIKSGSTLISLPSKCHLTYDGSTDPRLLALIDQVPTELWGAKLALQVVAHRLLGDASPYSPYIRNLPIGVAGLPMFYDGPTLSMIQYPPVTAQVKKRCRWLLSFTQQMLQPIRGGEKDPFDGADVDANALGWALAVVTSRAFRTRGPDQPAAMLPLIDMCNHSFSPNAKIKPGPGGAMCMVATRQLKEGEPVLISYGNLQNDFLLMDYGFIVPRNPYDTVQLSFTRGLIEGAKAFAGVGRDDMASNEEAEAVAADLPPLPAWQEKELAALQLVGPGANVEVTIRHVDAEGGPFDPRLLAAARVLCAPNAQALGGRSGLRQLGQWNTPLPSAAAETAAARTLAALCAVLLSNFPETVQEDMQLLAAATEAGLTAEQQTAISFRMGKKALMIEAMEAVMAQLAANLAAGKAAAAAGGSKPGQKPKPATSKGFGK
ncbi:histone-lysine N-methyltransferase setd3 [Chlorella sorokiniana]|uniref:Histone-lysine N-methyltransferase setd3 n=1 Tax=Chlorella sorokiniana TaxID=3076 RepID=A0A2P6TYY2_CHLSO|nr:histone-lysine N-methyltransferase setd3 [Chlorella sorokiniana]|eukprot:PRW59274.1 histone-lysine N-methyltransferase setd3 [Chlorella sorokiniana]